LKFLSIDTLGASANKKLAPIVYRPDQSLLTAKIPCWSEQNSLLERTKFPASPLENFAYNANLRQKH
jgi:hypothetical protein